MFGTGAMSYLSAPLWLCFLTLGTALWLTGSHIVMDWMLLPSELAALWAWTLCMLFLPRVLGIAAVLVKGEQQAYGGSFSLLRSALLETVIAVLQAPIRMLAHSLFVAAALTGLKLDWKSPPREAASVPWREALQRLAPMSGLIVVLALGIAAIDARALVWLLPVGMPLLLAIPMTVLTSRIGVGRAMREKNYLLIPEEAQSPAVLRRAWQHAGQLAKPRLRVV
jgi:membrane glycosyltransferase